MEDAISKIDSIIEVDTHGRPSLWLSVDVYTLEQCLMIKLLGGLQD